MTEDEFQTVYEALRLANTPYDNDEVPHLVAMEAKAWTAVQEVRRRADLAEPDPAS